MSDLDSVAARAHRFEVEHARRLRALAYRMLGSVADSEDIVQEAWLRWVATNEETIASPGAFLSRLVTRLCLDHMKSAAVRREQYVGTWLPELVPEHDEFIDPPSDPQNQAQRAQEVSVAFMLALERLTPLERAALLLHDVFDLDYAQLAEHLDRDPAACRQLVSRARRNARSERARRKVCAAERRTLFEAFANALSTHDVHRLAQILTSDAMLFSDGGGKVSAARRPLHGAQTIARVLVGFAQLPRSASWHYVPALVNGECGCLITNGESGALIQALVLEAAVEPGRIARIYVQRNPDKLRQAARWLGEAAQADGRVTSAPPASS